MSRESEEVEPMIQEIFGSIVGKKPVMVSEHYGVSDETFQKMEKAIFAKLILSENHAEVLDTFFEKLTAEDRVKVFAYANAMQRWWKDQRYIQDGRG